MMAYLIGIVTETEAKELQRRGWELGSVDDRFFEELSVTFERTNGTSDQMVQVFVDNDLFGVMNGPDWDKG